MPAWSPKRRIPLENQGQLAGDRTDWMEWARIIGCIFSRIFAAQLNLGVPVLYIGVTNNLAKRVAEHRLRRTGFTARYNVTTLVYVETTLDIRAAIAREKTLKGWNRQRKIDLIQSRNPNWHELAPTENAVDHPTAGDPSLRSG
jgi:putative endonuclease